MIRAFRLTLFHSYYTHVALSECSAFLAFAWSCNRGEEGTVIHESHFFRFGRCAFEVLVLASKWYCVASSARERPFSVLLRRSLTVWRLASSSEREPSDCFLPWWDVPRAVEVR